MNKNVLIGGILVLLAAGGYYQFSYVPAQKAAEEAAVAAAEVKAAEAAAAEAAAAAKAAEEAAAAAEAKAAQEAADAAAQAAAEAAAAATVADPLDPAKFDAAKVIALIDASGLDEASKAMLKTTVNNAVANPALVESAVAAVKAALGM
ncbi:MAG: hypothetical protein Q8Q26_09930 [Pseudorhodobacter sp.]|nr:hypothetical protein [Pseudorhodobacter sp.]